MKTRNLMASLHLVKSLCPALGAALGDFPSRGKCVCVWDGGCSAHAPSNLP